VTGAASPKTKQRSDAAQITAGLRSIATDTFPPLLFDLDASLIVSTYQAGRVVLVRA